MRLAMNRTIEIVEVGPRDGLQSEPEVIPTDVKVELIGRLVDAGVRRVEPIGSLVTQDPHKLLRVGDEPGSEELEPKPSTKSRDLVAPGLETLVRATGSNAVSSQFALHAPTLGRSVDGRLTTEPVSRSARGRRAS